MSATAQEQELRGDGDFVFYNQPSLAGGGDDPARRRRPRAFTVHFAQLPPAIERSWSR
ncbi:MAG: hypothetical protein IPI57_18965 [Candidatus Competibacteraceae bacterium]|nr:hypothetical protein [Candidatus Competibacteraceae bacterium]